MVLFQSSTHLRNSPQTITFFRFFANEWQEMDCVIIEQTYPS